MRGLHDSFHRIHFFTVLVGQRAISDLDRIRSSGNGDDRRRSIVRREMLTESIGWF